MESMETESKHFLKIMGNDVVWLRSVDDVLIVAPIDTDLEGKLKDLNEVEKKNQFTVEKNKIIRFLCWISRSRGIPMVLNSKFTLKSLTKKTTSITSLHTVKESSLVK